MACGLGYLLRLLTYRHYPGGPLAQRQSAPSPTAPEQPAHPQVCFWDFQKPDSVSFAPRADQSPIKQTHKTQYWELNADSLGHQ